jgi:hypothetical protein
MSVAKPPLGQPNITHNRGLVFQTPWRAAEARFTRPLKDADVPILDSSIQFLGSEISKVFGREIEIVQDHAWKKDLGSYV